MKGFSSKTLAEHLMRGFGAAGLITLALWLVSYQAFSETLSVP